MLAFLLVCDGGGWICRKVSTREYMGGFREITVKTRENITHSRAIMALFREIQTLRLTNMK